jgi:pimeloyl-ACP methyl ester carboxylesterase
MTFDDRVTHGTVENHGVKIHYASIGSGPLMIMIHGFPDYWYTWRVQMESLSESYQCVAIDTRGYNLSDKPGGVENYAMSLLVGDVAAVIKHFGREKALIAGHDWGGAIAWALAITRPEWLERLIILNVAHPLALAREILGNPAQMRSSQYAWDFQEADAHRKLIEIFQNNHLLREYQEQGKSLSGLSDAELLSLWVKDPQARAKYIEAFKRSDVECMLNYYKKNYPKKEFLLGKGPFKLPMIQAPVLIIFGLKDTAILPSTLNNTWEFIEKDMTLVTIPDAGHFVQQDAADLVTRTMKTWLGR